MNAQAFAPLLCSGCRDELVATFTTGAPEVPWRKYPPTVAPDGRLWETTTARTALRAFGFRNLAPASGPLRPEAVATFNLLVEAVPDLLERVKAGEIFGAEEMELIHGQVMRNRKDDASQEPEPVE